MTQTDASCTTVTRRFEFALLEVLSSCGPITGRGRRASGYVMYVSDGRSLTQNTYKRTQFSVQLQQIGLPSMFSPMVLRLQASMGARRAILSKPITRTYKVTSLKPALGSKSSDRAYCDSDNSAASSTNNSFLEVPKVEKTTILSTLSREAPHSAEAVEGATAGPSHSSDRFLYDEGEFAIVDASPLLDPLDYCRRSAFPSGTASRSGTDAALRLLRGKQSFFQTMSSEVEQNPSRPYALVGHGVPKQLLQEHINMADTLLSLQGDAAKCSFNNLDGDLSFDW